MVEHGGSSAGSYLTDPTSPIPSHCASIVVTSTVRVKISGLIQMTSESSSHTQHNRITFFHNAGPLGALENNLKDHWYFPITFYLAVEKY